MPWSNTAQVVHSKGLQTDTIPEVTISTDAVLSVALTSRLCVAYLETPFDDVSDRFDPEADHFDGDTDHANCRHDSRLDLHMWCNAARADTATPSKSLLLSMDPERRKKDAAALVLQRLLRGRAAQTRMYEGLQSRLALVRVSSQFSHPQHDLLLKLLLCCYPDRQIPVGALIRPSFQFHRCHTSFSAEPSLGSALIFARDKPICPCYPHQGELPLFCKCGEGTVRALPRSAL